ncbi:MAG: DUF6687 family protein [Dehalococcoidia bacterium]
MTREFDSGPMMRFLQCDRLAGVPHVFVDGRGTVDSVLVLSNQPGSATPREFLADTSAEIVLNFLRSPGYPQQIDGIDAISNDHFDLGGLLSVWALSYPKEALDRSGLVAEAARAGEFRRYQEDSAAQFACLINGTASWTGTPAGRSLTGLSSVERCAVFYQDLLPLVGAMLDDIRRFDDYWFLEYTDVIRSNAMRHSGAVQIEEYPELDLAILDTPLDLHDLTRLSCSSLPRLLTIRSENTYVLEYRYEGWVQLQSRRVLPRLDLKPLAQRLQLFERFAGRWRSEPIDRPVARLYLDYGYGPAPSSLDRETVVAEVIAYLQANAKNRAIQWSPYGIRLP